MSGIIQQKYISFLSSNLDRFKWIQPNKVCNFRCPICGDSEKSEYKARGYFYYVQKFDSFFYKCQNCGASHSFQKHLKLYHSHYYQEYRLELFQSKQILNTSFNKPKENKPDIFKVDMTRLQTNGDRLLECILDMNQNHPAVTYVKSRNIPRNAYNKIYYTKNFRKWVHQYQQEDGRKYPEDERIVFLMKDQNGNIYGAQGRALNNNTIRYITVKFDDTLPKLFGQETVNTNYHILVTEGVIDSFFLPNAVAICGGDIGESLKVLDVPFNQFIVLLDNEPRSKDTINRMEKAINAGCNVVFSTIPSEYKDINAMILNGIPIERILDDIKNSTYQGFKAMAKLKQWKRI